MLKKILIVTAVVVAALAVYVSRQPSEFNVTKKLAMDATRDQVFSHVNNLHKWNDWSPWSKLDPAAKNEFEGSAEGVGSVMKWSSSNKEVGEGSMKIVESKHDLVKIELEMKKPYSGNSSVEFVLEELNPKQTLVTWTIKGQKGFVAKLMSLFNDCEKMVAEKMEAGLDNLRAVSEGKVVAATAETANATASTEAKTEEVKK